MFGKEHVVDLIYYMYSFILIFYLIALLWFKHWGKGQYPDKYIQYVDDNFRCRYQVFFLKT